MTQSLMVTRMSCLKLGDSSPAPKYMTRHSLVIHIAALRPVLIVAKRPDKISVFGLGYPPLVRFPTNNKHSPAMAGIYLVSLEAIPICNNRALVRQSPTPDQ